MAKKKKKKQPSRYERVVQILDAAQGDNIPDYQGNRAFWKDYDLLMHVRLYGQRMIAPGPHDHDHGHDHGSGSCCSTTAPASEDDGGSCCSSSSTESSAAPGSSAGSAGALADQPGSATNRVDLNPHAAPVDPFCWPTGGPGKGDPGGNGSPSGGTKRSDRSGLIIGLRGQYPFDGSNFPPLLWNAAHKVSESDIAFIADWIDAGCPRAEDDAAAPEKVRAAVKVNDMLALARGDMLHKVSAQPVSQDTKKEKGLYQRREVSTYTRAELDRLREALECMYQFNKFWQDERSFDFWGRIHTNSCQHGWEQFLPWHRLYLYFFEQTLQDFDDDITLPYWSWSDYADANKGTYQTTILDIGIIPEAYRCWLTNDGVDRLAKTGLFSNKDISNLKKTVGNTYNSGLRFLKAAKIDYEVEQVSGGPYEWTPKVRAVYDELSLTNALWFPNRWPGSVGSATHYPNKTDIDVILAVNNWADFGGGPEDDHHFGALEEVHNGMHNFAGGKNAFFKGDDTQNEENPKYGWMTDNRVTAFDPIFWAHHSNVDRLWARWQELHPGVNPEDLDGALPPWSLTVKDTLSIKKLGYEYMRDSYHYPVETNNGILRFDAELAGVRSSVLDTHRKAEVRIHRVRRGNLTNASIRVFLNQPGATADTPVVDNEHYVGQVSTFHGTCYGGPGHCDLPLPRSRGFDKRRLHHHEPRNFRVDATEAVQRMLAKGEDDLCVQLVVVDIDGTPKDDAVYIDGVSLNFFD